MIPSKTLKFWGFKEHPFADNILRDGLLKLFVNRETEISDAEDALGHSRIVGVYGGLGVGKSSFLQKLKQTLNKDGYPVAYVHLTADSEETLYLACTTFVDAQVGRVIQALNDSPHRDNTVVVLFSDHGYHLGEKARVSKHGLWEESTRVPLIIVEPGKRKSQVCSRPVGLIDFYPTLLELCGLPEREANSGSSLVPLLNQPNNPAVAWRKSILTTYARGNHSLRSERFRYIRYEDGSEELYDHRNAPNEWKNLLGPESGKHESVIAEFRSQLPKQEAAYHPAVGFGAVNAWFTEFYEKLKKDR